MECTFTTITIMAFVVELLMYLYFQFKVEKPKKFCLSMEFSWMIGEEGRERLKFRFCLQMRQKWSVKISKKFLNLSIEHQRKSFREMMDNFLIPVQLALGCTIWPANRATYLYFTELQYILLCSASFLEECLQGGHQWPCIL